jgi:hypothetical protein
VVLVPVLAAVIASVRHRVTGIPVLICLGIRFCLLKGKRLASVRISASLGIGTYGRLLELSTVRLLRGFTYVPEGIIPILIVWTSPSTSRN